MARKDKKIIKRRKSLTTKSYRKGREFQNGIRFRRATGLLLAVFLNRRTEFLHGADAPRSPILPRLNDLAVLKS